MWSPHVCAVIFALHFQFLFGGSFCFTGVRCHKLIMSSTAVQLCSEVSQSLLKDTKVSGDSGDP